MSTYKVYMGVLEERLREDVKGKGIIPKNQTGFRKGLGTMDNIYVNYLVNRKLGKKGGTLMSFFVDLKAAFDSIDKGILVKQ